MQEENMKALNEQMMNVRLDIRELSTKVDTFKEVKYAADDAKQKADRALTMSGANTSQIEELKDSQKWLWRTVTGAIIAAIASGAIALLWNSVVG